MKFSAILICFSFLACQNIDENPPENGDAIERPLSISKIREGSVKVKNREFEMLLNKYDTHAVFIAYYFLFNSSEKVFYPAASSDSLCNPIDMKRENPEAYYVYKIDSILSYQQNNLLLNSLATWCENEQLLNMFLNSQMNSKEPVYFEQVVWELPETRNICIKYLKNKDQYWGSLDLGQSCRLYFDVLIYLQNLDERKRLTFFKKYLNTMIDLLTKKSAYEQ